MKLIASLQHASIQSIKPAEMASITAAFTTAEHYAEKQDRANSERYYLLAIQKSQVLKASIGYPSSGSKPTEETAASSAPGANAPALAPDVTAPAASAPAVEPTAPASFEPPAAATAPTPTEPIAPEAEIPTSDKIIGTVSTYSVKSRETLRLISAKLGVSRQHLVRMNKLPPNATLKVGQKLKYNNLKIIPQRLKNGILVNIPDRTLYYFRDHKLVASLPVALGVAKKNKKYDWTTPVGKFKIVAKAKDPTWYVPPSIQSEMEDEGKEVITSIPPGPTNPLGKYAIKTSLPGIMIHSTIRPGSIYSFASHGCIRVFPDHMEQFFKEVKVNTPGEIIYRPVKIAVVDGGRVFLEVHEDAYSRTVGLKAEAKRLIEEYGLAEKVDWKKVETAVKSRAGIPEDISL